MEWARWLETAYRVLARTDVPGGRVSTVFLRLDHNWVGDEPILLWESMVFLNNGEHDAERYASYEDAVRGHQALVAKHARHAGEFPRCAS